VHLELLGLDGAPQRGLEIESLRRPSAHVRIEQDVVAGATLRLGLIHGDVSIVQDVVAALARTRERDPDAHGRNGLVRFAECDRFPELRENAASHVHRSVGVTHVFQQHGELVSTEAGQQVAGAERSLQTLSHRDQQ
jgi:hypothetical protein